MNRPSTTLHEVVEQLVAEGHLSEDRRAAIETAAALPKTGTSTPWFMQAFIAIGAWLAAIFFLAAVLLFLFLSNITSASLSGALIFLGLMFGLLAIGLRRMMPTSTFAINLALAVSLLGQILFLGGIGIETNGTMWPALTAIGLEAILMWAYPDRLHRFLSSVALSGAVLALLADLRLQEAIHLLLWALALATAFFWENESLFATSNRDAFARPIGYGLPVGLLGIVALSIVRELAVWPAAWWISSLGLLLILLGWEYFTLAQYDLHTNPRLVVGVLVGTTLGLLPTLQAPGIAAALLVLVIGFRRGNRGLLGLAIAFLVVFLIAFYYNLELTLFWKSMILMGTGLACFALRFLLVRRVRLPEAIK